MIIYLINIIKGLRVIINKIYDRELIERELAVDVKGIKTEAEEFLKRDNSLKMMTASNIILALILMKVLIL